jgi:hypothetical protein
MIFSLDVRKAKKGDCLLLHFGTKADPGVAIVDGGPSGVYHPFLKPRLEQIKKARQVAAGKPLPIDLVMVSHVDDDHIQGILDLVADVKAAAAAPLISARSFWHNTFKNLVDAETTILTAKYTAAAGGATLPDLATIESDEPDEVVRDTCQVLAGIEQGVRLVGEVTKAPLNWSLNPEFNGDVILASDVEHQPVDQPLTFVVVGPMKPELEKLRKDHATWLKDNKDKQIPASVALATYADRSVANLSSVVVLAKLKDGAHERTMLLTGDARGDKVLKGLEAVGLIAAPNGSMNVDILKVPHHGSSNNVEQEFFERIKAKHYVFSGDGEHGNPERETIEMLLAARKDEPFTIHLTYPVDEIDRGREKDWKLQQEMERKRKANGKSNKDPRPDWNPVEQELARILPGKLKANTQHLLIVADDPKIPHLIELGDDKLGF